MKRCKPDTPKNIYINALTKSIWSDVNVCVCICGCVAYRSYISWDYHVEKKFVMVSDEIERHLFQF